MRVLIACEESQAVCIAFRERGHEAYSCDIQEPSGGHPEWHICGDALAAIRGGYIETMDGAGHEVGKWDLLIAHPPCTFLSSAGSTLMFAADHSIKDMHRYNKMVEAKAFFMEFYKAEINMICIENPAPLHIAGLPPYTQIIEPYMFGHPWKKRTCLWLNGLPRLEPTNIVRPTGCWVYQGFGGPGKTNRTKLKETVGVKSAKERSKTFPGIAAAMADQWGTPGGGYVQMSLF